MTKRPVRTSSVGSVATAALIVAIVAAVANSVSVAAAEPPSERKIAPDFVLADAAGKPVQLSRYKGRVVLLDFWATWCTGCKVEIPWYMEFQTKYGRSGLTSIGAAMDEEGWAKVKPYLAEHPISYPVVVGHPSLTTPYQISSLPVTLLIDRSGRIADTHVGMVDKDAWEREIQSLLAEKPNPARPKR